jgi:hypothetical protein
LDTIKDDRSGDFIVGRRVLGLGFVPRCNLRVDPVKSLVSQSNGFVEIKRDRVDGKLPSREWVSGCRRVFGVRPD